MPKGKDPKNIANGGFFMPVTKLDSVVRPNDLYREQSESYRTVFDVYDYLPFVEVGEIEHLNALIQNSATAQQALNKIANWTIGKGFMLKDKREVLGRELTVELTDEQVDELHKILTRKNADGEELLDVCRKVAYDYAFLGNFFSQIDVFDDFVLVEHKPLNFVRPYRAADLRTRFYGVSQDWGTVPYMLNSSLSGANKQQLQQAMNEAQIPATVFNVPAYPEFGFERPENYFQEDDVSESIDDAVYSSMIHAKQYAPEMYFWGLPEWISSKHWIELEYRIAKFNVSKFKNGLTPSGMLQLFGDPNDEDKQKYVEALRNKMTDTGNDFKVLIQILEDASAGGNFIPFEQSYQGFFLELATLAKEFISVAMGIPLSLVQSTAGQLGNNQQIRSEFEILYNTRISEIQRVIIDKLVKPYLHAVADYEGKEWLKDVELGFKNIVPVSYKGDLDINKVITVNEGREMLGLDAMQETEAEDLIEDENKTNDQGAVARFFNRLLKRK